MSSLTYTQIQDMIRAGIVPHVQGREVIWENPQPNAPRPNVAYIGLMGPRLVRETEPDRWQGAYDDGPLPEGKTITEVMRLHHAVYVDLTVYRDREGFSALDDATKLRDVIYAYAEHQQFGEVAFIEAEDVIDVAALLSAQYEPRAQFSLRFRVALDEQIVIPTIETIGEIARTFTY